MIATTSWKRGWLAAFAGLLACGAPAWAVPQFDVPFTVDTPGLAPSTDAPLAGGVSIRPTFVTGEVAGNSVLVQNTYTDSLTGNVFGDGNVIVLTDVSDESANAVVFQGAPEDKITSGVFTLSLDWIEDSGVTSFSSAFIGLANQTRGLALSSLFLDLGEPAGNVRSGNSVNFGATLGTATRGVPHHLDWVVDMDQTDFTIATEVYLDGELLRVHQREPIGLPHEGALDFGSMTISTSTPANGTMAFDNIMIRAGRHVIGGGIPGDVNNDGVVDIFDVNVVSDNWGTAGPTGDANEDGIVDIFDVNVISDNWTATGAAAVPEPATLTLGAVGLVAAALIRVRRVKRFVSR